MLIHSHTTTLETVSEGLPETWPWNLHSLSNIIIVVYKNAPKCPCSSSAPQHCRLLRGRLVAKIGAGSCWNRLKWLKWVLAMASWVRSRSTCAKSSGVGNTLFQLNLTTNFKNVNIDTHHGPAIHSGIKCHYLSNLRSVLVSINSFSWMSFC